MVKEQVLQELRAVAGKVNNDVPLARYTSFGSGGPAAIMAEAENRQSLNTVLAIALKHGVPWYILGNGTNLLAADSGFDGLVINLSGELKECFSEEGLLICGAGATLAVAANQAAKSGLAGLEPLSHIPGTIGGAVVMNAGAFGGQISDLIKEIEICDGSGISRLTREDVKFRYRGSELSPAAVVTGATLSLQPAGEEEIRGRMRSFGDQRRGSQPAGARTFGSVFKNPHNGDSAGSLLDRAGCKGLSSGGAAVSQVHANFVINEKNATTADAIDLMNRCRRLVFDSFGIVLDPEVGFLGNIGLEEI